MAKVPAPPLSLALRCDAPTFLRLACWSLLTWRLLYHLVWLAQSPFAWAPPSDGLLYERAARDLLQAFPWGTQPFYLSGGYAYVVALGLALGQNGLWVGIVLGLVGQVALAAAARRLFGPRVAWYTLALGLACRAPWFYENKPLSAGLGLALLQLTLWSLVWAHQRQRLFCWIVSGLFTGALVLVRGEWLLALPGWLAVVVALTQRSHHRQAWPACTAWTLSLSLVLAAMMLRNVHVTGHPDLLPVHGGGTSLYIGNNPHADGLWNAADIFNHARVDLELEAAKTLTEEQALADKLTQPATSSRDRAKILGEILQARAVAWITSHPADFARLVVRKAWLLVGNDELSQDFDWIGEFELTALSPRWFVPLPLLIGLAWLGWRQWDNRQPLALKLAIGVALLVGIAVNLVFFTSSQHRVILAAPLVLLAGHGLANVERSKCQAQPLVYAIAALLTIQAFWPRDHVTRPHPVHAYNLSLSYESIFEGEQAWEAVEIGLEHHPKHPLLRLRQLELRCRRGDIASLSDLGELRELATTSPLLAHESRRVSQACQTVLPPEK